MEKKYPSISADLSWEDFDHLDLKGVNLMGASMIPLVPILQEGEKPFAIFRDLNQKYRPWVLPRLEYDTPENLIKAMDKAIVNRALKLADELQAEYKVYEHAMPSRIQL